LGVSPHPVSLLAHLATLIGARASHVIPHLTPTLKPTLSLGIEAIAIGAGGNGGGAHSLQEWYESDGREIGLQRVLLTLLGTSGVVEAKS